MAPSGQSGLGGSSFFFLATSASVGEPLPAIRRNRRIFARVALWVEGYAPAPITQADANTKALLNALQALTGTDDAAVIAFHWCDTGAGRHAWPRSWP